MGATPMELGEASLQLSALIHDTASLDPGTCVGRGIWEGGGVKQAVQSCSGSVWCCPIITGPESLHGEVHDA